MKYEVLALAYRDLEDASGRLALIDRLAALLTDTPAELLPSVCYLCQGLIAPEFAGVDLGLAEKLAIRAVATATDATPEQVLTNVQETGDLGEAAEQLLAAKHANRRAGLDVTVVVDTLHAIAQAEGTGLAGPQARPAGRDARPGHTAGGALPAAPGHGQLATGYWHAHRSRRARAGLRGRPEGRPTLERAYSICCDLGLVAATLVNDGMDAVEQLQVRPATRCG